MIYITKTTLIFAMASNGNICVICQDAIHSGDNTIVPLPCMHTYHCECIKGYVTTKHAARQNIECPVCRQTAFQHGTTEYDEFCISLTAKMPQDIKAQATSLTRPPRAQQPPQITVEIHEIRPFNAPKEEERSCSRGWIFLAFILIIIVGISVALALVYT